jgi:hypothetical protein
VIALIAVLPAAVQLLAVGSATKWLLLLVPWPLLIVSLTCRSNALARRNPTIKVRTKHLAPSRHLTRARIAYASFNAL